MPRLDVRIVGARGLMNVQTFGTIDPFCTIEFEHKRFQTATADNTTDPQWNEVFKFNVGDAESSQLMFSVWNDNAMSDDFLGCYPMSISGLNRGEVEEKVVLLQQCKGNAELTIRIMAVDFGDISETEPETAYAPPRPKPHAGLPPAMQQQYQENYHNQMTAFQQAPPQQYQAPPPPPVRPVYQPVVGQLPPGFVPEEYLSLHMDLQSAVAAQPDRNGWAINHWNTAGHNEGRAYSRTVPPFDFDPELYINRHPDLVAIAQNQYDRRRFALDHWLRCGVAEGRRYRGEAALPDPLSPPNFNGQEYISLHPDLAAASVGQDPQQWGAQHYRDFGFNEGRAFSRTALPVDWNHGELYLAKYPDLAAAVRGDRGAWAANHWLNSGINEGRRYK